MTHNTKQSTNYENKHGSSDDANKTKKVPIVPDGGYGWVVCAASFYCSLICSGLASCFGIMLIQILETFDTSASKISLIGSIFTGLALSSGPLASALQSRFGHRFVIIFGSIFGSFGLFLSVFAVNVEMLIVTFGVIGGLFTGLCFFSANVVVGEYFSKRQAIAVSIATTGNGAGVFVVNYTVAGLLSYYGLRGTLLMLSSLVLNMAVAGALCRPLKYKIVENVDQDTLLNEVSKAENQCDRTEEKKNDTVENSASPNNIDETRVSLMTINKDVKKEGVITTCLHSTVKTIANFFDYKILKDVNTIFIIMIYFAWSVNFVVYVYLPLYAKNLGLDGTMLISISGVGYTVGQFLLGVFIDFLHVKTDYMMTASMLIMGVCSIVIPMVITFYPLAAILLVWSIAGGFCVSLRVVYTTLIVGIENLSIGFSLISFFNGIGYVLGPPLFGLVYDSTGRFTDVFYGCGVAFLLGGVLAIIINIRLGLKDKVKAKIDNNSSDEEVNDNLANV
ncbi:monocarboxylate transporter 9-like [Argonauta hians]